MIGPTRMSRTFPMLRFATVALAACLLSTSAFAADPFVDRVRILRSMTSDGDDVPVCLAELSVRLYEEGIVDCGSVANRWVVFDCDGSLGTSAATGTRMFDQAVRSGFERRDVRVYLDTSTLVDGRFCRVSRLDVYFYGY
jgi:hypothetical protein